jgi:outer membrane immunogenic protein
MSDHAKMWGAAIAGVLLFIGAMLAPAFATDLPSPMAVKASVSPVWSWQDCYLAMETGGVMGTSQTGSPTAGAVVGCNYQSGVFVYGFEGEASAVQASANVAPATVDIKSLATMAIRAGYAWHGLLNFGPMTITDALIYTRVELPANILQPVNVGNLTMQSGWGLAGGVEYMIKPWLASRVEYDFRDVNGLHSHAIKQMLVLYYSP